MDPKAMNLSFLVDLTQTMPPMLMIGTVSLGAGLNPREHQSCREAPLNDKSHSLYDQG
jgi:hypothetical protein